MFKNKRISTTIRARDSMTMTMKMTITKTMKKTITKTITISITIQQLKKFKD
ncbi:MAG: hypothetical protein RLZZ312_308 [Bacteroidota bacterium]